MKYRLIAITMLAVSFLPAHAQGVTTQGMAADIQSALKNPNQRADVKTLARIVAAESFISGEYSALAAVATAEQGHLPSCVDNKIDLNKVFKNVTRVIQTDKSIDSDSSAGILEAITDAYPCLTPRAFAKLSASG